MLRTNHPDQLARPLRREFLRWFCTAAWAAGAAALTAQAQSPAINREAEPPAQTTEPAVAAEPDAAAQSGSEPSPEWVRQRAAPPSGVDGQLHRLAADLKLDAGQQERIRPILAAQREQMQRLQRDPSLAPAERQRRILALGDRSADQIRAQLTDEQRAQYIKPRSPTEGAQATAPARRAPAGSSAPGADPKRN